MFKKIFIPGIILSFMACPAFAYKVKTFQPLRQPLIEPPVLESQNTGAYNYYNPTQEAAATESYPKITQLEYAVFKRAYERENIYNRLTRLENKLFRRNFSGLPLASRVDNLLANVDPGIMYGISTNDIAKLERRVFGRTYSNDDSDTRITRLEKEMLGAMQGGSLTERFETVKTAAKHYNTYPEISQSQTVYPQGYAPYGSWGGTKQRRGVNGLLQNVLGAIFGDIGTGTMTGFTPPIYDPYNPYGYGYNPGMGTQDYYMGNRGGYLDNRNIGTTSTVKILD